MHAKEKLQYKLRNMHVKLTNIFKMASKEKLQHKLRNMYVTQCVRKIDKHIQDGCQRKTGSSPSKSTMTLFSVAPVYHGHEGGCRVRLQCGQGKRPGLPGASVDAFLLSRASFICVWRLSSNVSVACLVRARHPVLS